VSDLKNHISEQDELKELLREFNENPFDPARKTPEDVMRVFYQFNVPILPVVSRRNTLLGIITKEEITAEMSDIERFSSRKIDDFVTRIARKRTMNELLPYLTDLNEFVIINIFGEVQGRMSRVDLVAAVENRSSAVVTEHEEIADSRDQKAMEWMIYLILEHIPRALYALNAEGKTIFYNSYFEDLYVRTFGADEVDHVFVEKTLGDSARNEYSETGVGRKEAVFRNLDLKFDYEKVPMFSDGEKVGYLVYCADRPGVKEEEDSGTLVERLAAAERHILVGEIAKAAGDISAAAGALGITKAVMIRKAAALSIQIDEKAQKKAVKKKTAK
jgi:transcriptional regulator with PAS, ATPase and Fis domain